MRIAVACDGLDIAKHFRLCSSYMCYTIEDGAPVDCRNTPALDQPLAKCPDFFHALGADTLIAGHVDSETSSLLESEGITVVSDASGDPLTAVRTYLEHA